MMVSTPVWGEGAQLYMPHIYKIAFGISKGDAVFSTTVSEDVWVYLCTNEYRNGLLGRIGTFSMLEEIIQYTIEYCRSYRPKKKLKSKKIDSRILEAVI